MGISFSIIASGLILNIAGNQSMGDHDVEVWLINGPKLNHFLECLTVSSTHKKQYAKIHKK